MCVCVCVCVCAWSVMSNSLEPHGPLPTRLLCPWDSPVRNTGVVCHFLLQGNLLNPGIKPVSFGFPALAGIFFTTAPPGTLAYTLLSYF